MEKIKMAKKSYLENVARSGNENIANNCLWFDNLSQILEDLDLSYCRLDYINLISILSTKWRCLKRFKLSRNRTIGVKCQSYVDMYAQ